MAYTKRCIQVSAPPHPLLQPKALAGAPQVHWGPQIERVERGIDLLIHRSCTRGDRAKRAFKPLRLGLHAANSDRPLRWGLEHGEELLL